MNPETGATGALSARPLRLPVPTRPRRRSPLPALGIALAFGLALSAASALRAETEPTLPWNPFEKAQKGDWATYKTNTKDDGGATRDDGTLVKVASVEGEKVLVKTTTPGAIDDPGTEQTFATNRSPSVLEVFERLKGGTVAEVRVVDDKKTVGGREFACQKVSFAAKLDVVEAKVVLWVCRDVKGGGLVAATARIREPIGTVNLETELMGFGSADKTEWGKDAAALAAWRKEQNKHLDPEDR